MQFARGSLSPYLEAIKQLICTSCINLVLQDPQEPKLLRLVLKKPNRYLYYLNNNLRITCSRFASPLTRWSTIASLVIDRRGI